MPRDVFGYTKPMSRADATGGTPWRRSTGQPERIDLDLRFDVGSLYGLRSTLAAHASQLRAPAHQIEALVIVAGELATNAVRHGGGTGRLRMWHHGDTLYCEVSDRGPGIADPTIGTRPPEPSRSDSHRGLWICRNLAQELTIDANSDGPGVTVTASIARPDHR
jgi:anti-sigma regulatory factor (Ser/Thr protein kinase)